MPPEPGAFAADLCSHHSCSFAGLAFIPNISKTALVNPRAASVVYGLNAAAIQQFVLIRQCMTDVAGTRRFRLFLKLHVCFR